MLFPNPIAKMLLSARPGKKSTPYWHLKGYLVKQHIPDNLCSQELKEALCIYALDFILVPPAEN